MGAEFDKLYVKARAVALKAGHTDKIDIGHLERLVADFESVIDEDKPDEITELHALVHLAVVAHVTHGPTENTLRAVAAATEIYAIHSGEADDIDNDDVVPWYRKGSME